MNGQYLADIMNNLYEIGVLKENERIVCIIDNCLLLERFTGKSYSYRICDFNSMQLKYLFSRQNKLPSQNYHIISNKINDLGYKTQLPITFEKSNEQRALDLLSYIFTDILPKHNLFLRTEQKKLSLAMLKGLQKDEISLCEAEVGTGKTHAYILAVTVHNLFAKQKSPTVISTSTIALQKALTEEYIPQISAILIEHRIIDKPLSFVIRKGKSHYLCQNRCRAFLATSIKNDDKSCVLDRLNEVVKGGYGIEVSNFPFANDYVKRRIVVEHCRQDCGFKEVCAYQSFLNRSLTQYYDFHITNHNFLIADLLVRKYGRQLIAKYGQVIVDEAHKLVPAAQSIYSENVKEDDIDKLIYKVSAFTNKATALKNMCDELKRSKQLLFGNLKSLRITTIHHNRDFISDLKSLIKAIRNIAEYFSTGTRQKHAFNDIRKTALKLSDKLNLMLKQEDWVLRITKDKYAKLEITALPKHLGTLLNADFWEKDVPVILTSGTMSVDGDFSHLKRKSGLYIRDRISEIITKSPFDYSENALLYLPRYMPFPNVKNKEYNNMLLEQITKLIHITHGHTLVLFTSYRQMEQVFLEVQKMITEYPLFIMGKGKINVIEEFRCSRNGVLFASDSAGEGIDLAGDILSSVIVVRLPFPVPDAMSEYEVSLYSEFNDFLNDNIIPTMLIKLRQWFGRGIRRETDSCVFSILDSRAPRKYKNDIITALPNMPVTRDIADVGLFIINKKDDNYFE